MLKLILTVECAVEDEAEARAKYKAASDILAVYPFITVSANISGQIPIKPESEEP